MRCSAGWPKAKTYDVIDFGGESGGRYDRQSPIVRLLDVARIQGSYRIGRLHDHAVGADDTIEVCPIEFTQRIADAHHRRRERREKEIRRLRAHEDIGPRPFAERAREPAVEEKGGPMPLDETVAAHPNRQEIGIACSLQEVPRQWHAVLERNSFFSRRLCHGVHEQLAGGQIALGNCGPGKPILFIGANARRAQIAHPISPKARVDRNVAGYGMFFPVGTVVVDPAIVGDKRQPELLLKGTKSVGKSSRDAS